MYKLVDVSLVRAGLAEACLAVEEARVALAEVQAKLALDGGWDEARRCLSDALHTLAWALTLGERVWASFESEPEPEEEEYVLRPTGVWDPEEVDAAIAEDSYLEFWRDRFRL